MTHGDSRLEKAQEVRRKVREMRKCEYCARPNGLLAMEDNCEGCGAPLPMSYRRAGYRRVGHNVLNLRAASNTQVASAIRQRGVWDQQARGSDGRVSGGLLGGLLG